MKAKCTNGNCSATHDLGTKLGGKLGGAIVGSALGGATKHPLGVFLGMLGGAIVGHFVIDELVVPACPSCGAILQVVSDAIPV